MLITPILVAPAAGAAAAWARTAAVPSRHAAARVAVRSKVRHDPGRVRVDTLKFTVISPFSPTAASGPLVTEGRRFCHHEEILVGPFQTGRQLTSMHSAASAGITQTTKYSRAARR